MGKPAKVTLYLGRSMIYDMPKEGRGSDEQTIRNCRFAFRCKKQWSDLAPSPIDGENVRYCDDCQESVLLCKTDKELTEAIRSNRCVALIAPVTSAEPKANRRARSNPATLVGLPSSPPYK